MNSSRKFLWLLALALTGLVGRLALPAQTTTDPQSLPALKSPVDTFRELLGMTPEQRKQALVGPQLLAKLREYEAFTPEERKLRLRATELRWWLLPLMRLPATNRTARLNAVPANLRKLVDERLALWDLFPPPLQQEWLNKEDAAQLGALTLHQRQINLASLPPKQRAELEAGLARWRGLTENQRRQTCEQFDSFFALPEREQQKVLNTFSEAERRQMEQTLARFEKLPSEKRQTCVRSFEKFANLSLAERQQFLKNAERWRQMTPAEQEAWRNLVNTAPEWPPLPPGADGKLFPPLPGPPNPGATPTTNGG